MTRSFEWQEEQMAERLLIGKAYERAQREIERDSVDPEEFRDLYGDTGVDEDLAYVTRMEEVFASGASHETQETHKVATVFEAIFHDQAELSEWLGPDAMTIKTSRYDDIKNGIDTVVETRHDDRTASHLGIAIDVALGPDLDKKFQRIKSEIERGELGQVKYFKSEHMHIRGEFRRIPRVVIGASGKVVHELAELWLEKKNQDLAEHPIQFQILEEMELQFVAFQAFARKAGQDGIAGLYRQALEDVRAVLVMKKEQGIRDSGDRDEVFSSIKSWMKNFKS